MSGRKFSKVGIEESLAFSNVAHPGEILDVLKYIGFKEYETLEGVGLVGLPKGTYALLGKTIEGKKILRKFIVLK